VSFLHETGYARKARRPDGRGRALQSARCQRSAAVAPTSGLLCITIIGLPFGFALFNRLPAVLTLRPRSDTYVTEVRDGVTFMRGGTVPQLRLGARVVWFLLAGWLLGAVYVTVAWFLCVIIITLPIGLYLYNRIGGDDAAPLLDDRA